MTTISPQKPHISRLSDLNRLLLTITLVSSKLTTHRQGNQYLNNFIELLCNVPFHSGTARQVNGDFDG